MVLTLSKFDLGLWSFIFFATVSNARSFSHKRGLIPTDLPGTWKSLGCYIDVGRTLFEGGYNDNFGMTDESCIAYCESHGFVYAGTEYYHECYCGNSLAAGSGPANSGECSTRCAGDSTESCGGPNRLNLFWAGQGGPHINPGEGLWSYAGCYKEGTTERTLEYFAANGAGMTVGVCTTACQNAGYAISGIEFGDECWCGNSFENGGGPAIDGDTSCSMTCPGNHSEYCGGPMRLQVYEFNNALDTQPAIPATTPLGLSAATSSAYGASSSTVDSAPSSSSDNLGAASSTSLSSPSFTDDNSPAPTSSESGSLPSFVDSPAAASSSTTFSPTSSYGSSSPSSSDPSSPSSSIDSPAAASSSTISSPTSSYDSSSPSSTDSGPSQDSSVNPSAAASSSTVLPAISSYADSSPSSIESASSSTYLSAAASSSTAFATTPTSSIESSAPSASIDPSASASCSSVLSAASSCSVLLGSTALPSAFPSYAYPSAFPSYGATGQCSQVTVTVTNTAFTVTVTQTASANPSSSDIPAAASSNSPLPSDPPTAAGPSSSDPSAAPSSISSFSYGSAVTSSSDPLAAATSSYPSAASSSVLSDTLAATSSSDPAAASSSVLSDPPAATSSSDFAAASSTVSLDPPAAASSSYPSAASSAVISDPPAATSSDSIDPSAAASSTYPAAATSSSYPSAAVSSSDPGAAPSSYPSAAVSSSNPSAAPSSISSPTTSVSFGSQSTTSDAIPTIPTPSTVPSALDGQCKFVGCYTEATQTRALNKGTLIDYENMTVEMCATFCSASGHSLFGLEWSGECYCGDELQPGSIIRPVTECNKICDGAPLEFCGAGNRLNVYSCSATPTDPSLTTTSALVAPTPSTVQGAGSYTLKGCYTEGTKSRALTGAALTDYNAMTVEMCASYCTPEFSLFGLEWSGECYCGNALQAGSVQVDISECSMPCDGNENETCGSGMRLNVYSYTATPNVGTTPDVTTTAAPTISATTSATLGATPTPTAQAPDAWKFYGCQTEATVGRALVGKNTAYDTMTLESCAADCAGYT